MSGGTRVAVVGGGVAGWTAANFAARAGARVQIFERLSDPGGRARTRVDSGFEFNQGPHALYVSGPAMAALHELGIDPAGKPPATSGGLAYFGGRLHALPGGAVSLLTTSLLGLSEKLELGGLMSRLPKLAALAAPDLSIGALLRREVRSERVRDLLHGLVRLTCYANEPERLSSEAAIPQLLSGIGPGVRYLDHGWQAMVDALVERARAAGVAVRLGAKVERVLHDGAARGLELAGGERIEADAVILALGPAEASALVDDGRNPFLARALSRCVPVRAAVLDLGLSRLPIPGRNFALGVDRALYYSVHSAAALLAPEGAAAISVARYLGADEHPQREELEAEFHALLDAVQPGWREVVVTRTLLRDFVVTHDFPNSEHGGFAGRTPGPVAGISNLHLAGDWVGPTAQLADASFHSGRAAAEACVGAARIGAAA